MSGPLLPRGLYQQVKAILSDSKSESDQEIPPWERRESYSTLQKIHRGSHINHTFNPTWLPEARRLHKQIHESMANAYDYRSVGSFEDAITNCQRMINHLQQQIDNLKGDQ